MKQNLKPIDQAGIKALIKERIENPHKYVNKPLIIWQSNLEDGIQRRILQDIFDEVNKDKSKDDRLWYSTSLLASAYDLVTPKVIRTDVNDSANGKYTVGLIVLDPILVHKPSDRFPNDFKMFKSTLRNREWGNVTLLPGIPVVAYMCKDDDWFADPELYPNAEQYTFEPDFDEWVKHTVACRELPQIVIDFIRGNGEKEGIIYRWYNFFNSDPSLVDRPGCNFPESWKEFIVEVDILMRKAKVTRIQDLDKEKIDEAFSFKFSDDVVEAFCSYIANYKG